MAKKFMITLGTTLLVAATASAGLVLSETWSDGDRTNFDLPTSIAWYTSGSSETLMATAADGGSMIQSFESAGAHVTGYLTPAGRIDLAIGERIELSFEFSFQNISGNGNYFRFGLFDSTDVDPRIAIDNNGGGGFRGTRGFIANVTAQNQGGRVELRRRNANSTNGTLITSVNGYISNSPLDTPNDTPSDRLSEALVSDVIYTGTMVVTRSSIAENIVSASITGPNGTIFSLETWTETASGVVADGFDLIAFGIGSDNRDSFTLHSLKIEVK